MWNASDSAVLDRNLNFQDFTDMPSNASSTFRHHPATSVFSVERSADAIAKRLIASSKVLRCVVVQEDVVAGHQKLSNPQKVAQFAGLSRSSFVIND